MWLSTLAPLSSSWRESSHCVALIGTYTVASVLRGSVASTSRLRRRTMKAESSTPHLAMVDSSTWPRLRSKARSKAAESAKSSGCRKWSSAHSSCRLFCSGVPGVRVRVGVRV